MSEPKLPSLPEPEVPRYGGYTGWEVVGKSFSRRQVESIRRETVRRCASAAAKCRSGLGAEVAIMELLKEDTR